MNSEEQLLDLLKEVYDPELGINIVDLGLIYELREEETRIYVRMTLTTPGCPLHDTIVGGVRRALQTEADGREIAIDLVWEPAWSPQQMSGQARQQLGFG